MPLERQGKRVDTPLPHTGEYLDGFGNHVTMYAYANPDSARKGMYGGEWGDKADVMQSSSASTQRNESLPWSAGHVVSM